MEGSGMSKISLTIVGDDMAEVGIQIAQLHEALNRPNGPAQLAVVPATAPDSAPAPVSTVPAATGTVQIVDGPPGQCPKHLRPWKEGKFGLFCSSKDETQDKGYCSLRPGDIFNGKRAAA